MPRPLDVQPMPGPDEPYNSLDELVRAHGAAVVLRSLSRVLRARRLELRSLEPDSRAPVSRAMECCEQAADELDEGEVSV
jgi:hypothetical protein